MQTDQTGSTDSGPASPSAAANQHAARVRVLICVVIIGCVAFIWWKSTRGPKIPPGVNTALYHLAADQWRVKAGTEPLHTDVLMTAADMASRNNDPATAVAAFAGIPDTTPKLGLRARLQEAQVLIRMNRARDAERSLQRFRAIADSGNAVQPGDAAATRKWLSFLYSVELRIDDRRQILADAHSAKAIDVNDSKQYFFPRLLLWKSSTGRVRLNAFLENDPDDLLLNIASARYLTSEGKLLEARRQLEFLLQTFPLHPDCNAALLECCFEQNDWESIANIIDALPPATDNEPHVTTWLKGEHALHEQRWNEAVRHFERALKTDAADPAVHMGLGKAYGHLGDQDKFAAAQHRSLILSRIRVGMARINEQSPIAVAELSKMCSQIGMSEAAKTFSWHADRIQQKLISQGPSQRSDTNGATRE